MKVGSKLLILTIGLSVWYVPAWKSAPSAHCTGEEQDSYQEQRVQGLGHAAISEKHIASLMKPVMEAALQFYETPKRQSAATQDQVRNKRSRQPGNIDPMPDSSHQLRQSVYRYYTNPVRHADHVRRLDGKKFHEEFQVPMIVSFAHMVTNEGNVTLTLSSISWSGSRVLNIASILCSPK